MKLLRLNLENFRGAPDGEFSFTHPTTGATLDLIHVTGPAACGKTSFLEAIAALKDSVGSYGASPDPSRLLRRGARSGRVAGTFRLDEDERVRAGVPDALVDAALDLGEGLVPPLADAGLRAVFAAHSHDPARGKFEYFAANRRLAAGEGRKPAPLVLEAGARLGANPDKYASLRRGLLDLALSDGLRSVAEATARGILLRRDARDSLGPYRRDIAALAPGIRLAGVELSGVEPDLVFERRDGTRLGLDDLADSEKQAVLFAVTFRRLGLSRSIVLVDQPELYLAADLQLRFARELCRLGTDNQMFLATGSPEITRAAAPHEIVTLAGARP
jgi:hypothetical protein